MNDWILYAHLALGLFLLVAIAFGRAAAWRWAVVAAALAAVASGGFNFMTRMAGAPRYWHAAMGIKILLALHFLAMAFLLARGGAAAAKQARYRRGALISGALVALTGLYFSNLAR